MGSYGAAPPKLTAREAFWGPLKADDLHCAGEKNLAPYQPDLLKIVKGKTVPKPAVDLLPPEEAAFLIDPEKYLVRSQPEIDAWTEEHPAFRPYWDPRFVRIAEPGSTSFGSYSREAFRDSGPASRQRLGFSSFGSRLAVVSA